MIFIGFSLLSMQQISKIFQVEYEDNTSWADHYQKLKKDVYNSGLVLQYNKSSGLFSFGIEATILKHTRLSVYETSKYLSSLEEEFIEIISSINKNVSEYKPIVFDYSS